MESGTTNAVEAKEAAANEALEYYKNQISQLEAELADFQASSRELEQELGKELEASEKQHRELRQKNEGLRYEVEEWKVRSYHCCDSVC
jgi:predicted  nucleic acid-binding Zn-ribbon protein